MSCAGRQDRHVSRTHCHFVPVLAAQHQARLSSRKPQHLMCRGMVVMEVEDAVSPLRRPAVPLEHGFEMRCRIRISLRVGHSAVQQHRQVLVVRHPAVSRKLQHFRICAAT